jgi:APA family basic amino acid/polyamine antiporter
MSNDGLLPPVMKILHKQNKTPHINTMIVIAIIALLAGTCPLDTMVQMGNFCVIAVFITVCVMAIYLRRTQPDLKREFKCPMMPIIPVAGIGLFTLFLVNMPNKNVIFYFLGLVVVSSTYYLITRGCSSKGVTDSSLEPKAE